MKYSNIMSLLLASMVILFLSCKPGATVEPDQVTADGLKWYTLESAYELNKSENKKILIDFYTSWCGWCKVMDKKTFTDPEVIKYINKNFIPVKFNAELRESFEFMGNTYEFKPMGRRGANTFAIKMLSGRMGYPSLVFTDANFNPIKVSPGYKKPHQLMTLMKEI